MIISDNSFNQTKEKYQASLHQNDKKHYQTKSIENVGSSSKKMIPVLDETLLPVHNIENLIKELNSYLRSTNSKIFFSFNERQNVIDANVQEADHTEVIRAISFTEFISLSVSYRKFHGILFDKIG